MNQSVKRSFSSLAILLVVILSINTAWSASSIKNEFLKAIKLPEGFQITLFADNIPNARSMTLSPGGILFVGTRKVGKVYAVIDRDKDYQADNVLTIADELYMPNGVAFRDGSLFVAEVNRILRFDDIENQLKAPPKPTIVSRDFPSDPHHGWKYIAFGPDDRLYVPVGAPCNVCDSEDKRFSTIMRMKPDGRELEIFASGIRNSVGFDWHPQTMELWFTNNGRDWMGDDMPPDTLHRGQQKGMHFGFPFCHGGDIPDPKFGKVKPCRNFSPPALKLPAHVAPLGMKFYTGAMFPPHYRGNIFIAEHGSWNRSIPVGYRITRVILEGNRPIRYEVFADGWLQSRRAWGRPVDILEMPDGSLLVSDDGAGVIYRISYRR